MELEHSKTQKYDKNIFIKLCYAKMIIYPID